MKVPFLFLSTPPVFPFGLGIESSVMSPDEGPGSPGAERNGATGVAGLFSSIALGSDVGGVSILCVSTVLGRGPFP